MRIAFRLTHKSAGAPLRTLDPAVISVEEALDRILAGLADRAPVAAEDILCPDGLGRRGGACSPRTCARPRHPTARG